MAASSAKQRDEQSPHPPRKRAKYTQVACKECKRRKLKCTGGETCTRCVRDQVACVYPPSRQMSSVRPTEDQDDRVTDQFQAVNCQFDEFRQELRGLSARLCALESTGPAPSSKSKLPVANGAEFGIGQQSSAVGLDNGQGTESIVDDHDDGLNLSTVAPSPELVGQTENLAEGDPLRVFGLEETLRLLQVYEHTVGVMYPCVDLISVCAYASEYFHRQGSAPGHPWEPPSTGSDQDWFYARDIQLLKIIVATSLLVESHGRSEWAAQLADSVEDRFASRLKIAEVDMKEILILTLLSIFHSYRDDEVIAWRLTGMAARGSMELGLHRQDTWQKTGGVFPGALEWMWASRLFWCIYVLDRKWSIGTGLPFAIQDSDMDTNLPEPDHSTPYLTCMITYARLSTKIWGLIVGWQSRSREATSEGCAYLDSQVQQWVRSIPRELRFDPNRHPLAGSEHTDRAMMLQVLLALQANQLRILVYRQNLLGSERIADDVAGASTAVETAKSTVHMLDYFSRVSHVYFQRPEPFNYFLISALAAMFLALLHAPPRFSQTCRPEFYLAVDMVRRSATRAKISRRLQKIIRSLKCIQLNTPWQSYHGRRSPPHHLREPSAAKDDPTGSGLQGSVTAQPRPSASRSQIGTATPASPATTESSPVRNTSNLRHLSGIPTPQPSSGAFWPLSPLTAEDSGSNGCEDLSSFFEIAGDLYFDPRASTDFATEVEMGMSHLDDGRGRQPLDALQAEDEALTRVMVGLL